MGPPWSSLRLIIISYPLLWVRIPPKTKFYMSRSLTECRGLNQGVRLIRPTEILNLWFESILRIQDTDWLIPDEVLKSTKGIDLFRYWFVISVASLVNQILRKNNYWTMLDKPYKLKHWKIVFIRFSVLTWSFIRQSASLWWIRKWK